MLQKSNIAAQTVQMLHLRDTDSTIPSALQQVVT